MSEILIEPESAERRVFGDSFTFKTGGANMDTQVRVYKEKIEQGGRGEQVWIPADVDAVGGLSAELYRNRTKVAQIVFSYESWTADVYSYDGEIQGEMTHAQLPFDEAVVAAESLADQLSYYNPFAKPQEP
jgi:hypothetical protein